MSNIKLLTKIYPEIMVFLRHAVSVGGSDPYNRPMLQVRAMRWCAQRSDAKMRPASTSGAASACDRG